MPCRRPRVNAGNERRAPLVSDPERVVRLLRLLKRRRFSADRVYVRENGAEAGLEPIQSAAASVGATDVFVFRRVAADRYVHVGGLGRGAGWAGNIEISSDDADARRAIEARRLVRLETAEMANVLGPYYARSAAFVPVSDDVAVLFGTRDGGLVRDSDAALVAAAEAAAEEIELVSPAKRLADELEVLHAVDALTTTDATDVPGVMQHIVDCAAASLSCELGVLYLQERELVAVAQRGWSVETSQHALVETMREVMERKDGLPVCAQDTSTDPLPDPFVPKAGIRSHYLLAIGNPPIALLLLMHTDAHPRGFTMLCRELGLRLAERGEGMLRVALARELEERRVRAVAVANERLLELDRMKDDFVSLVTHELRTPLTSVHGYVDLLLEDEAGELTDQQRHFLGVVERNCDRLLRLVGDLLSISRANAEGLELELDDLDPGKLAADALEAVRPAANRKRITLELAAEPIQAVRGDRIRLGQLLDCSTASSARRSQLHAEYPVRGSG